MVQRAEEVAAEALAHERAMDDELEDTEAELAALQLEMGLREDHPDQQGALYSVVEEEDEEDSDDEDVTSEAVGGRWLAIPWCFLIDCLREQDDGEFAFLAEDEAEGPASDPQAAHQWAGLANGFRVGRAVSIFGHLGHGDENEAEGPESEDVFAAHVPQDLAARAMEAFDGELTVHIKGDPRNLHLIVT